MQFSRLLVLFFVYGYCTRSPDILSVWYACTCGSYFSFTVAPLLDASVYKRMRKKNHWSLATFYAGHAAMHIAPMVFAFVTFARPELKHGLVACAVHLLWFCMNDVDELYVPLPRRDWHTLMLLAMTGEILCCK